MPERRAKPKAPTGLEMGGRRLWRNVVEGYNLRVDELRVLEDACRTADVIDELQSALKGQPLTVSGSGGQPRPHPLMVEIRQQRIVLAAMLRQLRLPDELGEAGLLAVGSNHSRADQPGASPRSVQARAAAMARWSQRGESS